jgi:hypothetical protein
MHGGTGKRGINPFEAEKLAFNSSSFVLSLVDELTCIRVGYGSPHALDDTAQAWVDDLLGGAPLAACAAPARHVVIA